MAGTPKLVVGLSVVVAAMAVLFASPRAYFAAATIFATGCMLLVSYSSGVLGRPAAIRYRSIAIGLGTALLLYMIFVGGAAMVAVAHPFGITSASEASIYSLIVSPSNPPYLQVLVLLFDSAGYESFFRGVLQKKLQARIGVASAPAVALLDAVVHLASLNLLWVGATFVTDLVWGLTYHYANGKQASFASHFVWDLAIFIVRPVT